MTTTFTFSQYQRAAKKTAIFRGQGTMSLMSLMYLALGLNGEAGEVAGIAKKIYRDGESTELANKLVKETGDCLWYLAMLCEEFGGDLGEVAQKNLDKLLDRQERGVLQGSGDDR